MDIPINLSTGDLIIDMILGFVILSVYNFVNYNKLLDNGITTIFSSFVLGYSFRILVSIIPISFSSIDLIGLFLAAILTSYGIAVAVKTQKIEGLIDFLKIRRTTNHIIWLDLLDLKYTPILKITMPNGYTYIGYFNSCEEYTQTPIISLFGYKIIKTDDSQVISDYSKIPNRVIVLDTNKADSIEII